MGALVALLVLAFAPAANAALVRPFKEIFGPVEQPSASGMQALTVDSGTGDVLLLNQPSKDLRRFKEDGTPAPFAALGSNVIDGKAGPGGKPCSEEPASCDQTPQNEVSVLPGEPYGIAVDDSGSATDGDIYLTQKENITGGFNVVDIFSSEGRYLGQLTNVTQSFHRPCGVTVDSGGAVYVASESVISKFVPTANPPVNGDKVATFEPSGSVCSLAAGLGPTAGAIFGAGFGAARKFDSSTGALEYPVSDFNASAATVDPSTGNVLATASDGTATEYDASGSAPVELDRIIPEGLKSIRYTAYNLSSEVYANYGEQIALYGLPKVVPSVIAKPASNVIGTKATLNALVNPQGVEVTECLFEYGTTSFNKTAPCEGSIPTDHKDHAVHANISGLTANGQSYQFRLVAKNENGPETGATKNFITAQTVVTEAASAIDDASATLNGLVRPEGLEYTECLFEYGLASHAGYEESAECVPGATALGADFSPHAVSASLEGLEAGAVYRFRILATNSEGTRVGKEFDFETLGPPQISEVRAVDATRDSVTLEAKINPSGFGTSYRFEWGPTSAYGNQVPSGFEPFIGSGTTPVRVSAKLTDLSDATTYHYRVVASSNLEGTTTVASPDQTLETLNSCGLPEGRCLEMVSPRELGPIGAAGRQLAVFELHAQAGDQPGALAYTIEGGLPDATRGTQVLYGASRGVDGWISEQVSPPTIGPDQLIGVSNPSQVLALSPDLSCGVLASNQPLTGDPQAKLIVESGGGNLYRRNPDGTYDLITDLAPENPELARGQYRGNYTIDGMSDDCSRIAFESNLHYPGVPGSGETRYYEWSKAGGLRSVGMVPSGGGEEALAEGVSAGSLNAVSGDGSRLFFSATRLVGKVGGEVGKAGVFVREGGESRDISATQTSTPDNGATYVGATPDGSHAYFTANAGLTAESSESGTDLYEYDLESETLTDLSPVAEGVAGVAGLVGVAEDGSRAYFVARRQLIPGRGPTTGENEASGDFSIYDASESGLRYAGVVDELPGTTTGSVSSLTARVSPEGRYLLFESEANVTAYDSGGRVEAYLYDAEAAAGGEATVCVSCRQDGKPPLAQNQLLISGGQSQELYVARSLVVRDGRPLVFFRSVDPLAPGAPSGESSLYEWAHGQVFHLAAQPASVGPKGVGVGFAGASADGTDLYFFDAAPLNWENREERYAAWDARIGGGFAEPPAPNSCDPTSEGEGACRGSGSGSPSSPSAASRDFHSSGNVKEAGGGANNRCTGKARRAQRLSARAKKLRRNARRVSANGHHTRAVKLNRNAKGLAQRARGQSNKAKRCRKRLRANDNRRAGK